MLARTSSPGAMTGERRVQGCYASGNISRRRDMLYGTQRGGQMRHFRKDLKTATRLGAVLDPFKSIIYTSIRARARRFIFFYF